MTITYADDLDVSVEESLGIFLAWQNLGPAGNGKNKWHDPQGAPGHRYRYQKSEPGSRKSKAAQPSLPIGGQPEPVEPKAPKPPTKAQIRAQEVAARKEQRLKVKEEKAAAKAKAQQDRLSARQAKVDAKAASAKELAELPAKTRQYVQDLLAGKHGPIAPEHVQAVADMVSKMKQSDVNALKKEVALRVGGKKVEQAKAIAAKALKMAEKASPGVSDVRAAADAFRNIDAEGMIAQISALPDEQILQAARQAGIDTSGGKKKIVADLAQTLGDLRAAAGGKAAEKKPIANQSEPVDEPSKKAAVPAMSNKALRDKAWKAMEVGEYAKDEGYGIDGSIAADVIGLIDKMEEGSPLDVEADILRMLERSSPGEIPDPASHAAINALGRKALDSLDDAGAQQALRGIPAYNPRTKTYRAVLDKNLPGLAGWLRDKFGASPEKSTANQPEPVDPRPSPRRLPPPSIDDADAVSSVHKAIRDATRSGKPEVAARVRSAYEAAQGDRAKMAKLKEGLAGLVSRASPAGQPEPAEANGEDEYSLDSRIRSGSFDAATADEANDYLDANARSMKISDLKKLASSWGLHSAHGSKGEIIRQIKNYISKIAVLNGQTDF